MGAVVGAGPPPPHATRLAGVPERAPPLGALAALAGCERGVDHENRAVGV